MYDSIVKGEQVLEPGLPESFNVLVRELQALCLDVKLEENNEEEKLFQSKAISKRLKNPAESFAAFIITAELDIRLQEILTATA